MEVLLDPRRVLVTEGGLEHLTMIYRMRTYWSFVVIQISSRGIPDFLIATAVVVSVPTQTVDSQTQSSPKEHRLLTIVVGGVNQPVSGLTRYWGQMG